MAGYIIGSEAWLNHTKERILFIGDLLVSPLTTYEEKLKLLSEQAYLVIQLCDSYKKWVIED